MSNYMYVGGTKLVKPGAGKLKSIFVSAVSGSPTITVYDSFAASGAAQTIIGTFVPTAATTYNFYDGIYANLGIRIEIGGTVVCTVVYE